MHERRFIQCDVFTEVATLGNGLTVVVDSDRLSDVTMQRFASWSGMSETTFILPPTNPTADYRIRIFTPTKELGFAGHPTLGSCAAWLHTGGQPKVAGAVVQECGIGNVIIDIKGKLPGFVAPPTQINPMPGDQRDMMVALLKIAGSALRSCAILNNGPVWHFLELEDAAAVLAVDANDVMGLPGLGVGLLGANTPEADTEFEIRMLSDRTTRFEDPITGSLNAAAAVWLAGQGRLTDPVVVAQGSKVGRRGRVHLLPDAVVPGRILVAGQTHILVEGMLRF